MAVIYLPQQDDFGSALGRGVSQGLSRFADLEMKKQMDAVDQQRNMQAMNMMKRAGSREKALEILTTPGLIPFKSSQELENARRWLDEMYPPVDQTPTLVEGFDKNTGDPMKAYARRGDLLQPDAVLKALGPNATLTKPDLEDFYMDSPPGEITHLGRRPRSDQQPGEHTKTEMELMLKERSQQRADNAANRSADAAERGAAAAERSARASERGDERLNLDKELAFRSLITDHLNVKKTIGQNGEITFDFSGETPEKQIQFRNAMERAPDLLKKHGSVAAAVSAAVKELGIAKDPPVKQPDAPNVEEKKPGILDKVKKAVSGGDIEKRFVQDPAMKGKKLGKLTKHGMEVLENGKLIGYYR